LHDALPIYALSAVNPSITFGARLPFCRVASSRDQFMIEHLIGLSCVFLRVYIKLLQNQFHFLQNYDVISTQFNSLYKLIYVQKTCSRTIGFGRHDVIPASTRQERCCEIYQFPARLGRCGIQYIDTKGKSCSIVFGAGAYESGSEVYRFCCTGCERRTAWWPCCISGWTRAACGHVQPLSVPSKGTVDDNF